MGGKNVETEPNILFFLTVQAHKFLDALCCFSSQLAFHSHVTTCSFSHFWHQLHDGPNIDIGIILHSLFLLQPVKGDHREFLARIN